MAEDKVVIMIDSIIKESKDWLEHPESRPYPFNDIKLTSGTLSYGNLDPQVATKRLSRIDRIIESLQNQGKSGLAVQIREKVEKVKEGRDSADHLIETGSYRPSQCIRELEQATREFVGTLEHIKQMNRENEKSPAKHIKEPSNTAKQAYLAFKALGYTQTKLAEIMTDRLKPQKPFEQYQMSRMIGDCEKWLKANNLDVFPPDKMPVVKTVDPDILDMGARTDDRLTGDPRHKHKPERNGDIDE